MTLQVLTTAKTAMLYNLCCIQCELGVGGLPKVRGSAIITVHVVIAQHHDITIRNCILCWYCCIVQMLEDAIRCTLCLYS